MIDQNLRERIIVASPLARDTRLRDWRHTEISLNRARRFLVRLRASR